MMHAASIVAPHGVSCLPNTPSRSRAPIPRCARCVPRAGDPTRPPRDGGALAVEDRPRLFPEGVPPRGVRVKVAYAALNFADLPMARGEYQEKPALPVPGGEFSGVVAESGAERAAGFAPGAKVAGVPVGGGAMAERWVRRAPPRPPPTARSSPAPPALAAFPVCHGTAHPPCASAPGSPKRARPRPRRRGRRRPRRRADRQPEARSSSRRQGRRQRAACADAGADAADAAKLPRVQGRRSDAVFEAFER